MRVLITGGTGFVGSALTSYLLSKNVEVNYLTTSKNKIIQQSNYKGFYWNPENFEIDENCIKGVEYIINLSGKSISCRWNKKNKEEILFSRINSSKTLYKLLAEKPNSVKKVISASAIGIYKNNFNKIQSEQSTNFSSDFLGRVCQEWEFENKKFVQLNIDTLIVRFGLVLSAKAGALPQFTKTIKYSVGGLLGSGKQWYSWIHIDDLVRIINFGIEENVNGVINGVAPYPKTQKEFLITLSQILNKKLIMPRIPTAFLKMVLGEMHHLITDSQKISADKLLNLNFKFNYPVLKQAFKNLYKN